MSKKRGREGGGVLEVVGVFVFFVVNNTVLFVGTRILGSLLGAT